MLIKVKTYFEDNNILVCLGDLWLNPDHVVSLMTYKDTEMYLCQTTTGAIIIDESILELIGSETRTNGAKAKPTKASK